MTSNQELMKMDSVSLYPGTMHFLGVNQSKLVFVARYSISWA